MIKKTCLLLLCLILFTNGAHSKMTGLTKKQKEWQMNAELRKDPSFPVDIVSAGYRLVRAYHKEESKTFLGQSVPAADKVVWEWQITVKNKGKKLTCVEVMYLLWDKRGSRLASSYTGSRLRGQDPHTFRQRAEIDYADLSQIAGGDFRIRASSNLFSPLFCTGASMKNR